MGVVILSSYNSTSLEYMIIWSKIQVIINPLSTHTNKRIFISFKNDKAAAFSFSLFAAAANFCLLGSFVFAKNCTTGFHNGHFGCCGSDLPKRWRIWRFLSSLQFYPFDGRTRLLKISLQCHRHISFLLGGDVEGVK